jgi:selenophosphate synthetase-related protein
MGEYQRFIWQQVFEFPANDGRMESVVWRAKAVTEMEVHALGTSKQRHDVDAGKNCSYGGFMTAAVGMIRQGRTGRGHTFRVFHKPDEGDWHAVIQIVVANGTNALNKNDKNDVRSIMAAVFESNYTKYQAV